MRRAVAALLALAVLAGAVVRADGIHYGQLNGILIFYEIATPSATPPETRGITLNPAFGTTEYLAVVDEGGGVYPFEVSRTSVASDNLTVHHLGSDASGVSVNTLTDVMTTTSVGTGLYHFRYIIRWRSSSTSVGAAFAVNHTGTTTTFLSTAIYTTTGTTDATGVGDQTVGTKVGQLVEGKSERAVNTASSFSEGVDTADSDMLTILEGLVRITATTGGNSLVLRTAAEGGAGTITVKADTTLILTKVTL